MALFLKSLMISAIAARKAAQAARQPQQQEITPQRPPSPPPQSPKRKPTSQRTKPSAKKAKKDIKQNQNVSLPPPPKLDVFKTQDDLIIIDSEDDDSDGPVSQVPSEESDIEILPGPPAHLARRAWSPSMPLDDSSADEGGNAMDVSGLIDVPARLSRLPETNIGTTLSTFVPVPGQNLYYLSSDDVAKMGLRTEVEGKGTVVVLEPEQKMCVLGTCRLTLLKGTVLVNGVPLHPSTTSHNIFAPRSSPLPVIEGRVGNKVAVDSSLLPLSLQPHAQTESALVLLQELRSNVEGLGRVCRIFEGVYEPSGWHGNSISAPFQLNGLYLVCISFLSSHPV